MVRWQQMQKNSAEINIQKHERTCEHMENLVRDNIAMEIAWELSDNNILDEDNFSYDTAAILEYVRNIILEHLKDVFPAVWHNILSISNNCYINRIRGCL